MTVELTAGDYRVVADPAGGGALLSADWRSPKGAWIALLAPMDDTVAPFKAGCFAMVPFANRIADGRFRFQGRDFVLPINHQEDQMAIHGFAREHPWSAVNADETMLVLAQDFAQPNNPYRFRARQKISLSDEGIHIGLAVQNTGSEPLPFGIGLHPWFVKTPNSTLSFASAGAFQRDLRGLPVPPLQPVTAFDPTGPKSLGDLPWLDGFFAQWRQQKAQLLRPEQEVAIDIEAYGAFHHLHVFVPDNRAVLCAEPVSHAPDVINRPELGSSNGMDVLVPGATLSGTMTFRAAWHPLYEQRR